LTSKLDVTPKLTPQLLRVPPFSGWAILFPADDIDDEVLVFFCEVVVQVPAEMLVAADVP
jgi:hypothetical protein